MSKNLKTAVEILQEITKDIENEKTRMMNKCSYINKPIPQEKSHHYLNYRTRAKIAIEFSEKLNEFKQGRNPNDEENAESVLKNFSTYLIDKQKSCNFSHIDQHTQRNYIIISLIDKLLHKINTFLKIPTTTRELVDKLDEFKNRFASVKEENQDDLKEGCDNENDEESEYLNFSEDEYEDEDEYRSSFKF